MFITLEGIEGSGKTTLIENLADVFRTLNHEVLVTREPGGCALGRELRQMLLNPETEICPEAELFLFLADRAQHVAEVIRPALKRGEVVLCDRYADSTVVYQGYGRGLDIEKLRSLNDVAIGGLWPVRTFVLDMDPAAATRSWASPKKRGVSKPSRCLSTPASGKGSSSGPPTTPSASSSSTPPILRKASCIRLWRISICLNKMWGGERRTF